MEKISFQKYLDHCGIDDCNDEPVSKEEAMYADDKGTKARSCGNCQYFKRNSCSLVKGNIDPAGRCKLWESKKES